MAKRKRLTPPAPGSVSVPQTPLSEGQTPGGGLGLLSAAPIAQVAGDVALESAFQEVRGELESARSEGRMVMRLPLEAVDEGYLIRDRMAGDDDDMKSLAASIAARGQQTPIEVVALAGGRYGLISGWRRLRALRSLADGATSPEEAARHATVQALVRRPQDQADAYVAMIEENEIRADLSFFERARVVDRTVSAGVFKTDKEALQSLFAAASFAKRSKVKSFLPVVRALDGALRHPSLIPERLGLSLAKVLAEDAGAAERLRGTLAALGDPTPEAERRCLERAVRGSGAGGRKSGQGDAPMPAAVAVAPGIRVAARRGRVEIEGEGIDPAMIERLTDWLRAQG